MRSPGFGPGFSAWKAEVLPLDYKRKVIIFVKYLGKQLCFIIKI